MKRAMILLVAISFLVAQHSSAEIVKVMRDSNSGVLIINASAVPLQIVKSNGRGGICPIVNHKLYSINCFASKDPITVSSGQQVIAVSKKGLRAPTRKERYGKNAQLLEFEAFYPGFAKGKGLVDRYGRAFPDSFTGGAQGWINGFPVVRHKGVLTKIAQPGYWVFGDDGVYRAHRDPKTFKPVIGNTGALRHDLGSW